MITLEGDEIKFEWKKRSYSVKELLKELNLHGEMVVVKVNGKVVTEFDEVRENDQIEMIRVFSGG